MPKNIFVYPCDSFIGRSVAKAFSAAGHAVSGLALTGANVPPSVHTVIRADDSDVTVAQKQLLLTADVVVYDLLGNERAARDAVVQLTLQPYGGREVVFVAVSSPLVWAATRPSPGSLFASLTGTGLAAAAGGGEWGAGAAGGEGGAGEADAVAGGSGDGEEAPWPGTRGTGTGGGSGVATGSGDGEEFQEAGEGGVAAVAALFGATVEEALASRPGSVPIVAPTFTAPEDVTRRLPAASARAALAVEHLVLRAGRRGRLRTAVVCPGLLYGEGEDDMSFYNAFKAAWTRQCLPTRGSAASGGPPPRLLVYGRGTNVMPTLHVADLASYVMALAGLPVPPPPPPPAAPAAAAVGNPPTLAPAPPSIQTLGSIVTSGSPMSSVVIGSGTVAGSGAFGGGGGGGGRGGGSGSYYLVTDGSRCTQAELVAAIAASMGLRPDEGAIEYVPESELHLHPAPLRSRMLLDLSLATTHLPGPTTPGTTGFVLSRPAGLPGHLPEVVAEFRSARRLTPLRVLVSGPPLSGKTHLARRLAHRYGLSYISVPLLLAAAGDAAVAAAAGLNPAMDPALLRAAQLEVAAGPSGVVNSKEKDRDKEGANPGWLPTGGRVSARTLGALLSSALADPRVAARCRGFVMDGFPRSAAQARAAFYTVQVDEVAAAALAAEQSHVTLKGHKSHRGEKGMSLAATPSTPKLGLDHSGGSAGSGLVGGGASADVFELPPAMKLVTNPLTAPTHVIELDVGEEELRVRLAALAAAAEEVVTRITGETGAQADLDKKAGSAASAKRPTAAPGGPGGPAGKGGAGSGTLPRELILAAALGHNGEAGFTRRMAAYGNWRAEDASDLRSRVSAAEAAWEAERLRQDAERARLAAEASTLKAKRRRARAAAAAAAANANTTTFSGENDEDDVAAGNGTDVTPAAAAAAVAPELPQHGGLMALSLGASEATHIRLTNPTAPEGPLVTISVQPPPALMATGPAAATSGAAGPTSIVTTVAAAAAAAVAAAPPPPPPLSLLERTVEALLGPPHNLDGFPEPGAAAAAAADPAVASKLAALSIDAKAEVAAADGKSEARTPRGSVITSGPGGGPAAAAVEAGADASYCYRWRGNRGAAVRRYLLRHVMPVVTAALAEVALARTGGPVSNSATTAAAAGAGTASSGGSGQAEVVSQPATTVAASIPGTPGSVTGAGPGSSGKEALLHVARALAAAAEAAEAAFVDPYSDPSYGIQLAKIDAKAAREAARAAVAAAKAEREAAARQQQQQQLAVKEEDLQQQQQQQ